MTTEEQLIVLFCLVDDWVRTHPLPGRPGPRPACAGREVLALALALALGRELPGGRSERRKLRWLRRAWRHLFPHLPAQSDLNRRTRWLEGAWEGLRRDLVAQLPSATSTLLGIDTSPVPLKHRTRGRRGRGTAFDGPQQLTAGFGDCVAKRGWVFGFRLAALVARSDGVPRQWPRCPAAVAEREVAAELLGGESGLLVADRGGRGGSASARGEAGARSTRPARGPAPSAGGGASTGPRSPAWSE